MGDPENVLESAVDKHRKADLLERDISDCVLKHIKDGLSYGELFRAIANVQRRWSGYLLEDEYAEQATKSTAGT